MSIGIMQLALIVWLVLILFGAGKLPKVMGDIGRGVRALREGMQDKNADSVMIERKDASSSKKEGEQ